MRRTGRLDTLTRAIVRRSDQGMVFQAIDEARAI
jgi:hypothetical protein